MSVCDSSIGTLIVSGDAEKVSISGTEMAHIFLTSAGSGAGYARQDSERRLHLAYRDTPSAWGETVEHPEDTAFAVGDWWVEPDLNRISWEAQTTALRPQVMELLVYLAKQKGRVVSADELLDNVWSGKVVSDNAVYNCVAELRHALADGRDAEPYLETVPKRGYRLLAPVSRSYSSEPGYGAARPWRAHALLAIVALLIAAMTVGMLLLDGHPTNAPADENSQALIDVRHSSPDPGGSPLHLSIQLPQFADASLAYNSDTIALSPDGRQIAYVGFDGADVHLYVKGASDARARRIQFTGGASTPSFSPDGDWIAFFADGQLKRVSTRGGRPLTIGDIAGVPLGLSWGDDDNIVFNVGYRSRLQRISSAGGRIEALTHPEEQDVTHRRPHVLPGARALLYQVGSQITVMQRHPAEIWLLDLESGEGRFLFHGSNPKYSGGSILFFRPETATRSVWAIDVDLDTLAPVGEPVPVVTDPVYSFDVARSGALLYTQSRQYVSSRLRIVDREGNARTILEKDYLSHPAFAGDGRSLAISIGLKTDASVSILDLTGERNPTLLTSDRGIYPVWSRDDRRVAYAKSTVGILAEQPGSSAAPEILVATDGFAYPTQWLATGLLYGEVNLLSNGDLFFQPSGGGQRIDIDTDSAASIGAEISPNGRWVAYSKIDTSRPNVFVKAFPDGQRQVAVATIGGDNPKWAPDGSRLYFESFGRIMSVGVTEGDFISFTDPVEEFRFAGKGDITFDPYDVSPDGRRFAIVDTIYGEPPEHIFISSWRQSL